MEADVEELEEGEERVKVRPFSNAKRLRGSGRAASCSDLLLELEPTRGIRLKVSKCTLSCRGRLTQGTIKISHSLPLKEEKKNYFNL